MYLCSVYTRGWNEFRRFANKVGRDKIIAGGYHPTAMPDETLAYAHKVVTGYCGNIDAIVDAPQTGVFAGTFGFTAMRRDLIDQSSLCQVYPDIQPNYRVGSMVSSIGCPFDCSFCSTPQMSDRKMRLSPMDYVEQEIQDLVDRGVQSVFVRDESFATNPNLLAVAERFAKKFEMVYSFGTGNVMGKRPEMVKRLGELGWHSLNFGLEDVGENYRKNKALKEACDNCHRYGVGVVLSFIVNDRGKTKQAATENYRALYDAFCDLKPAQVCANFLMPLPGTGIWKEHRDMIDEDDFDKYDSKTPLFCDDDLAKWHRRAIVALQLKYYQSDVYNREVREFTCGDTLHLRCEQLAEQYDLQESAEMEAVLGF